MDEDFMFWLFEHYMLTEDDYFDLNEEEKNILSNLQQNTPTSKRSESGG